MTIPKSWQPGDPITAAQLNTGNVEASRPRRAISLGSGSSLINETLGNQSVSAKVPLIRLVVATEDFAFQIEPTDLNGVLDDVPSGLVREVRLNRRSGMHVNDEASKTFRAYDVTAGLTGVICEQYGAMPREPSSSYDPELAGKAFCDVFYVMFNQDSKRWEVMAAGGSGGGHTIWFTIDSCLCPEAGYVEEMTLVVTATQYNQSCTGVPPGANYEGTYDVYDLCNYLYGLTPSDLVGTTGRATYMYPLTGACEPKWIIDDLCASPVCG